MSSHLKEKCLDELEQFAYMVPTPIQGFVISELVHRIRNLEQQLVDPNYMYAGGRIHRAAILCRNADIDRLQDEVNKLKEKGLINETNH